MENSPTREGTPIKYRLDFNIPILGSPRFNRKERRMTESNRDPFTWRTIDLRALLTMAKAINS